MAPEMIPSNCPYCGGELGEKFEEDRQRLYCGNCDRIIWRNAEPVSAVIVREEDEILMIKRGIKPGKGSWSIPAGFLEVDETAEEAAVRELEEETGLAVDIEDLEFVETLNMERFPDQRLLATVFTVKAEEATGKAVAGSDAEKVEFLNIKEARESEKEIREHFTPALDKVIDADF